MQPRVSWKSRAQCEEEEEAMEEVWDGNLLLKESGEITEGVKVSDTEKEPSIEFSEKEKRRLEKHWTKSLIIKILGGSVGYMLLKKRLQALWGKGGKIEILVIGNGYMILNF